MNRLWPGSIRGRLLAAVILVMTVVLAGSAAATAWGLSSYLDGRVSDRLLNVRHQIQQVLALNVANEGGLKVNEKQLDLLFGENTGLILVIDGQAGVAISLPDVPAHQLISEASKEPGQVVFVDGEVPAATIDVPTKGLSITLDDADEAVDVDSIVLAVSRDDDRKTVARLIRIGVLVGLVALALLGLVVTFIVRAGLRPLTELADAVHAVGQGGRTPDSIPRRGSTETEQVALAVRDAFTARARAEDRLRSFVADASHELRTPLTKISGWVDLYLQGGVQGEAGTQAAMEKVEAEVGRMGLLVEELSLLARLDAQVPLDRAEVDVVQLAREVLDDARVVTEDRVFTLETAGPATVLGDAERLRRVLRNLVGNAVQHTPPGTPVEMTVGLEPEDTSDIEDARLASGGRLPSAGGGPGRAGRVVVAVRDHGAGIPAAQLPNVFERFWRADESRTRAKGGSGLGLAIVEAVIVAHGGSVAVTSQTAPHPDQGTTVTFRLPSS